MEKEFITIAMAIHTKDFSRIEKGMEREWLSIKMVISFMGNLVKAKGMDMV